MFPKLVINARKSFKFIYIERIAPHFFFGKALGPFTLELGQKYFGSGLYAPWRGAHWYALFFFEKSANLKHSNGHLLSYIGTGKRKYEKRDILFQVAHFEQKWRHLEMKFPHVLYHNSLLLTLKLECCRTETITKSTTNKNKKINKNIIDNF